MAALNAPGQMAMPADDLSSGSSVTNAPPGQEVMGNPQGRCGCLPCFRFKKIDWIEWEKSAKMPEVYNPPQLKRASCCQCLLSHRSPYFASPAPPCCCAGFLRCCVPGQNEVSFADPDEMLMKMLSVDNPKCPADEKGVFWMEGNTAGEVLMSWQDADWLDEHTTFKRLMYNWTRDPTCFGTILAASAFCTRGQVRAMRSPDRKWIALSDNSCPFLSRTVFWTYIFQEGDKVKLPDGSYMETTPGDGMRVNFKDNFDSSSEIQYQYLARRVAYLDDEGKLVKTKAWDELSAIAASKRDPEPCCGGYFFSNLTQEEIVQQMPVLNSATVVRYAPGAS